MLIYGGKQSCSQLLNGPRKGRKSLDYILQVVNGHLFVDAVLDGACMQSMDCYRWTALFFSRACPAYKASQGTQSHSTSDSSL